MTALELLSLIRKTGARLWSENGDLRVQAPSGTLTEDLRRGLAQHKREIVRLLERVEGAAAGRGGGLRPLERVARGGDLPLSFAQERLWVLSQLEPESTTYNMPMALRLEGVLDVRALVESLRELVRRHETLRTVFPDRQGKPVQRILSEPPGHLAVIDLTGVSFELAESEGLRLSAESALAPFDLVRGPLFRGRLLRFSGQDHVLSLNMHHIVSDGWSMGVLSRELKWVYEAFSEGRSSPLPELPVQYADFAVWQRKWLEGRVLEEQLSYWKQQLDGAPQILELPTDFTRPAVQTHAGAQESLILSPELANGIRALSRREGATLFMVLLGGLQLLFRRHTGQEDIVVGAPIAGRNRSEVEGLIGFFLNLLALRTDVSGGPSFAELLGRVREVTLGAYAHQDIPFEHLLDELKTERDLSRTALFQVCLNVINLPDSTFELAGLRAERFATTQIGSKFDMTLYVHEADAGIRLTLSYAAELFKRERIREMLRQYEYLLSQIVAEPDRRIEEYSLVTPAVQELLPDPRVLLDDTFHGAIHDLLVENARRKPHQVAVRDPGESWTYQELDARSNQLANYLRGQGIEKGDAIAIYGHRSAALVWTVLGVLKAAAAFVILDPANPARRLIASLRVTGPRGWLQVEAAGELPQELEVYVDHAPYRCRLTLRAKDAVDDFVESMSKEACGAMVGADDLACIGLTSGSTGEPKGVEGRHGSLTHFVPWMVQEFGLTETDRYCMLSGLAHDPLQREMFTPLQTGATLCIPEADHLGNPDELVAWLRREGITVVHLTPAMVQVLGQARYGQAHTLRYAFVVGDVLTLHDIERLERVAPALTSVNLYGTTETQRAVSYHVITSAKESGKQGVPLGRGMPGVQLLVLTDGQQLAGIGELGQLYVRSPHLARGYVGDAAYTHEKFIPNPFTGKADDRLYATGDLGRYLPDGNIEFVGRVDQQIKIRGFRIEPGEIEVLLAEHPGVREAVVVARSVPTGDPRAETGEGGVEPRIPNPEHLVAYVVCGDGVSPAVSDLRQHLRKRVPDYMIPAAFVFLDALPLTPNEKVDRDALPEPTEVFDRADIVEPRSAVEQIVAQIWSDVLGLEQIGIHDNFFELGGHSLLATQVMSRVSAAFEVTVPLRDLFEAPTVAELCERVEGAREKGLVPVPPVRRRLGNGQAPVSFSQQRLWFLDQLEPDSPFYNLPYALRLKGCLEAVVLEASLNEITRRHESLRTTFSVADGEPVQVIHPATGVKLHRVDLRGLAAGIREPEVARLVHEDAHRSFDLSRGPLFRVRLLEIAAREHVLLYNLHHIISDGWSSRNLTRELRTLVKAFGDRTRSPLEELPVQYADYALWERNWLQGAVLEQRLRYWRDHLAGAPAVLELPADRPRPKVETFRGERYPLQLSPELSGRLQELSRREGATVFMTLLAAFNVLLYRLTGQGDLVVGMVSANRTRAEIERLIGFFVNLLPLRTQVEGGISFRALLRVVRRNCLAAYEHQEMPFEKIVEDQRPARDLSHAPVFQVVFDMANPVIPIDLPGLSVEILPRSLSVAQYDLVLHAVERSEAIEFAMEYSTELFDRARIERMLGDYSVLLEAIVADPGGRVSELPLLTEVERRRLLVEWNDTARKYPEEESLHTLFEAQVERTPEATAVVFGREQLTYRELNGRANQLARHLRGLGVGPEVLVGILMERSLDMVVGLLGILKAGGAYVPLDPDYPQERLEFMVRDSGMAVLLTQSSLKERQQGPAAESKIGEQAAVLALGQAEPLTRVLLEEWDILAQQPGSNLQSIVSSASSAYVIYTSGSTGQPKGVQIAHGALVNFLKSMENEPGISSDDVLLSVTTLSFDIAGLELFLPLVTGARAVLVSREVSTDGAALQRQLDDVTVMQATPATWRLLVDAHWTGSPHLRVLCGGEALAPDLAGGLVKRSQGLWNLYGPTETTVWSTVYPVMSVVAGDASIAIGRPISNTDVYILDRSQQLAPIGVVGELMIGGAGVARGYLNRPDLTAEKFFPHPHTQQGGARLYRTGDLTRYLADGNLEFLGRSDQQVKVRGLRIELGEIEAVLGQHPAVSGAVVVARPTTTADRLTEAGGRGTGEGQSEPRTPDASPQLVAYVCVALERQVQAGPDCREGHVGQSQELEEDGYGNIAPDEDPALAKSGQSLMRELRRFAGGKLPAYMVPQRFMVLDALPLTPNGKLDRKALPEPDWTRPELGHSYVGPRTETEEVLVGIWAQLLHLDRVGIHDNFFELGGHSLLATQVVQRTRDALRVEVPLRSLFETGTVAEVAELIDTMQWAVRTPDDASDQSTEDESF